MRRIETGGSHCSPQARATSPASAGPQVRPWHGPMPARVHIFTAATVRAPSAMAAWMAAASTSSQRQIVAPSASCAASASGKG